MIHLRRLAASGCAAFFVVLTVLTPASVFAHSPVANAVAEYAQNTTLSYYYAASGYPSWVTTATNGTLTSSWPSSVSNNSASPQFSQGTSGGIVTYIAQSASPCSGSTAWLACSSNWGTTSFHIYIRDLGGAPNGSWAWYDVTSACPPSSTCFYARRVLIHERRNYFLVDVTNHERESGPIQHRGHRCPHLSEANEA